MNLPVNLDEDEAKLWEQLSEKYQNRVGFSTRALVAAAMHFFSLSDGQLMENRKWLQAVRENLLAYHSKTRGMKMRGFEAREKYGFRNNHRLQQCVGQMEYPKQKPFRDVLLQCVNEGCKLRIAKGMFSEPNIPPCPTEDSLALFKEVYGSSESAGDLDEQAGPDSVRDGSGPHGGGRDPADPGEGQPGLDEPAVLDSGQRGLQHRQPSQEGGDRLRGDDPTTATAKGDD